MRQPLLPDESHDHDWTKIWDARMAALVPILGEPADAVFHAKIRFEDREDGGSADVVPFPHYIAGSTYVTAELTGTDVGQQQNSLGNYELMICTKKKFANSAKVPAAANFISQLACYTCDAVLDAAHTKDIGQFFEDSTIRAVLFTHPGEQPVQFEFLGQRYGLLLCIGITAAECAFARSGRRAELLALLKKHGIFPYTIPGRPSVPLPPSSSSLEPTFGI